MQANFPDEAAPLLLAFQSVFIFSQLPDSLFQSPGLLFNVNVSEMKQCNIRKD